MQCTPLYFRNLLIVSRLSGDVPVVPFSCGLIACGFQLIGSCGCQGLAAVNYSESGLSVKQHVEKHSTVYFLCTLYLMQLNNRCHFNWLLLSIYVCIYYFQKDCGCKGKYVRSYGWYYIVSSTFCNTFKVECPMSGAKSMFSLVWNGSLWMWLIGCCTYHSNSTIKWC